jgi:predicted metalloprotease with PDZ domain
MITSGRTFNGTDEQLGVFAHEFFHNWNVERIRPKSLEPFNFEKSNMSELLWVAEGFTQYYGLLLMKRSGLTRPDDFYQQMASLINAKENTPGGRYYTPVENSQRAVYVDAGVSIDRTNYPNMFTTYYFYGAALALSLDLQLREQFHSSLDHLMKEMWKRFGKTEKAYTLSEMQTALASISNTAFAADFFKKYVYGHESIDYAGLLQAAGLQLNRIAPDKAWIGNVRFTSNDHLTIASNTTRNTPLYEAGVDIDDILLQLDGKDLKQAKDLETILSNHKPGDSIKLLYKHRDQQKETTITLKENPSYTIVPFESNSNITESQKTFRANWLDSKVSGF